MNPLTPRDRILQAAMTVFRRHGFRRSSIEETAEAAGLTRQALYHHFKSKEALFRAAIEQIHEAALAAGAAAVEQAERGGKPLPDIVIALASARLKAIVASFAGSPHVEELFSEHLIQARDLYQHYAELHDAQVAAAITRAVRRDKLRLAAGMTPAKLARFVELAIHGAKSAHPSMQPVDGFLRDVDAIVRTLIAGAFAASAPKSKPFARPVRKTGVRK